LQQLLKKLTKWQTNSPKGSHIMYIIIPASPNKDGLAAAYCETAPPAPAPEPGRQESKNSAEGPETSIIEEEKAMTKLLYQGHGSMRITTPEGMVIYVDPYAGTGYDIPADLILVTHQHGDHNQLGLIAARNPDCVVFSNKEALEAGVHNTLHMDGGSLTVEATEAGNKNHNPAECVGFILTFSDGVQLYVAGDTDKTAQMGTLAARGLDYAFFPCDGRYNMDTAAASECAALVGARHSIPYHLAPGALFDRTIAERFEAEGRLIVADGEEIALETA
jgi:L-ascorbate metabolism protein UlaG (beta-lactamase superfamily)